MNSWLSQLPSGVDATSLTKLVKKAVNTVESQLDKVLDIQEENTDFFQVVFGDSNSKAPTSIKNQDNKGLEKELDEMEASLFDNLEAETKSLENDTAIIADNSRDDVEDNNDKLQEKSRADVDVESVTVIGQEETEEIDTNEQSIVEKNQVFDDSSVIEKVDNDENDVNAENVKTEAAESTIESNAQNQSSPKEKKATVDENLSKNDQDEQKDPPADIDTKITITRESEVAKSAKDFKMILEQRESQLLKANQQIADLQQELDEIKSQAPASEDPQSEIKVLKSKIVSISKENQATLQKLQVKEEQVKALTSSLEAKEENIKNLLAEGEQLAKDILKSNNTIKKVKQRENDLKKELETANKSLEQKNVQLESQTSLLESQKSKEKDFMAQSAKNLTTIEKQKDQISALEKEGFTLRATIKRLEEELRHVNRELQETKASKSQATESQHYEALKKEKLHEELIELKSSSSANETRLSKQLDALKESLVATEEDIEYRQEKHRKEIEVLQQRLQQAETRNEELSILSQETSKPLLRQIESMRSQHQSAINDWEHVEAGYQQRLKDAEKQVVAKSEELNAIERQISDLSNKLTSVETQLSLERQDKSRATIELEMIKEQNETLRSKCDSLTVKLELILKKHSSEIAELENNHLVALEKERQGMKTFEENEIELKKKISELSKEIDLLRSSQSFEQSPRAEKTNAQALLMIEKLQSDLKQAEQQNQLTQRQLELVTANRDEMADELIQLSNENESIKQQFSTINTDKTEIDDIKLRYNTVLELLGEKEEKILELQADIIDMKAAFKDQLESFLNK